MTISGQVERHKRYQACQVHAWKSWYPHGVIDLTSPDASFTISLAQNTIPKMREPASVFLTNCPDRVCRADLLPLHAMLSPAPIVFDFSASASCDSERESAGCHILGAVG